MKKKKKLMVVTMIIALAFSMLPNHLATSAQAAKAPKLDKPKLTLRVGQKKTLKVKYLSSKVKRTWKTNKKKIATVTKKGKVTARKKGKAKITVTFRYKKKTKRLSCTVTVKKALAKSTPQAKPSPSEQPQPVQPSTPKATPVVSASAAPQVTTPAPVVSPTPQASVWPAATLSPTIAPQPTDTSQEITQATYTFEDGTSGFTARGSASVATGTTLDSAALLVTGRTSSWHGAQIDLKGKVITGNTYRIRAVVSQQSGSDQNLNLSLNIKNGTKEDYPPVAEGTIPSGEWKVIEAEIAIPAHESIVAYVQAPENKTLSFAIKEFSIKKIMHTSDEVVALDSLYAQAAEYGFSMGTVYSENSHKDEAYKDMVQKHFNSISCANEMKAYALLDQGACQAYVQKTGDDRTPQMNYSTADNMLYFAADNGIGVRGHTLVWDANMSDWFYREGYSSTGAYVSKDVLLARMENYIRDVVLHFDQIKKKGTNESVVYCWDVVNEAVGNSSGQYVPGDASHVRTTRNNQPNKFYDIIGHDYVKYAFQYARKYAPANVKLFYNDYSTIYPDKRNAICNLIREINASEKLVDGVGMQSYNSINSSILKSYTNKDAASIPDTVDAFSQLGLEVHLTEETVKNYDNSEAGLKAHADFYYQLFETIKKLNETNRKITNVSIWGLCDSPLEQEGSYTYNLCGTYYGLVSLNLETNAYQPKTSFLNVLKSLKKQALPQTASYLENYESGTAYTALSTKGDGGSGEVIEFTGAQSGTHVLKVSVTADWHGPQYSYTNPTTGDITVKIAAWVRNTGDAAGEVDLRLAGEQKNGSSTKYPSTAARSVGSAWTELKGEFVVRAGETLKVRVAMQNGGTSATYLVDDFSMVID